jgi:hypothetical protein
MKPEIGDLVQFNKKEVMPVFDNEGKILYKRSPVDWVEFTILNEHLYRTAVFNRDTGDDTSFIIDENGIRHEKILRIVEKGAL